MPWFFLLLALAAFAVAFKTTSVALAVDLPAGRARPARGLGDGPAGAARRQPAPATTALMLDPQELRRLREQAEARRAAAADASTASRPQPDALPRRRRSRLGCWRHDRAQRQRQQDRGAAQFARRPRARRRRAPRAPASTPARTASPCTRARMQRHIRADDVLALAALTREYGVEFNLEGNPFAPPRAGLSRIPRACANRRGRRRRRWCPTAMAQLTSDHGFDFVRDADALRPHDRRTEGAGLPGQPVRRCRRRSVERAAAIGADRIEIYTGPYAEAFAAGDADGPLRLCADTARRAQARGLGRQCRPRSRARRTSAPSCDAVPDVLEVSIGHALIGEALYDGLAATVARYLAIVSARQRGLTARTAGTSRLQRALRPDVARIGIACVARCASCRTNAILRHLGVLRQPPCTLATAW